MATKPSTLTQIAQQRSRLDMDFLSRKSIAWLNTRTRTLRSSPATLAKEIINDGGRSGPFSIGKLYHFAYDPKTKEQMPYYDIFPLVIPLNKYDDGFLGMNLHYLPPLYRATFLDKLSGFAIMSAPDEIKRLRVSYEILKAAQHYPEFKPCLKKYLFTQVKSKIMTVHPNEWETALFLPTANFKGAPLSKVYSESLSKI